MGLFSYDGFGVYESSREQTKRKRTGYHLSLTSLLRLPSSAEPPLSRLTANRLYDALKEAYVKPAVFLGITSLRITPYFEFEYVLQLLLLSMPILTVTSRKCSGLGTEEQNITHPKWGRASGIAKM